MTLKGAPPITEDDLQGASWHKSSYSGSDNNCVERGRLRSGRQAVRDTKDRERGSLVFGAHVWGRFVDEVRGGRF